MYQLNLLLVAFLIGATSFSQTLVRRDVSIQNYQPFRIVTEVNYDKLVNGDQGIELVGKTSIRFLDSFDVKIGVSEGFTGLRGASLLAINHATTRFDFGVFWYLFDDWYAGYTHSERKWFDGAYPRTVFIGDSMDTLSLRKEFNF